MKLKNPDKKVIKFSYPFQMSPGFIKRKSLLANLQISEEKLNISINRLLSHKYIKISEKQTSHEGICYELTDEGIKIGEELNRSIFEKIYSMLKAISIIAIIGFLISYFLDLFAEEIKTFIMNLINGA